MAETNLSVDDLRSLSRALDGAEKPRCLRASTWKGLKAADPYMIRISMSDVRSQATGAPDSLLEIDLPLIGRESFDDKHVPGGDHDESD